MVSIFFIFTNFFSFKGNVLVTIERICIQLGIDKFVVGSIDKKYNVFI